MTGPSRTIIRDACVITMDPVIGDFPNADILIEGDRIAAVAPAIQVDDAQIIDGSNAIAIPGLVDAHRHSWQTTIRHMNSDMVFMEYVTDLNVRFGKVHKPEHKYAGVLVSALEALNAGVTTIIEYALSVEGPDCSDAMIAGLKEAGVRGLYCHGVPSDWVKWWTNSDIPHAAEDARRVRARHFTSDDALLGFGMALRGPEFTTPETNRRDFALARDLDARITLHIEAPGAIESMRDYLGPDTCYVHCCRSTDLDLELIRDSGGHINVTPECEMGMHNAPVTKKLLDAGMLPSLGVSGAGTISGDMFIPMRMAYQEVRMRFLEEGWRAGGHLWNSPVTTRDALAWGTIEGARQFGLEDRIGTLTPGKQADIALLRHDSLHMSPMNHPVAAVVLSAGPADVDTVFVAGKIKKRHGKLVGVDVDRIRRLIYETREYLFEQAGRPDHCGLAQSYQPSTAG
jgi:cytosine/adenosine deaminase-related metal-dependent hydrolase